jgi:hypothetical protein
MRPPPPPLPGAVGPTSCRYGGEAPAGPKERAASGRRSAAGVDPPARRPRRIRAASATRFDGPARRIERRMSRRPVVREVHFDGAVIPRSSFGVRANSIAQCPTSGSTRTTASRTASARSSAATTAPPTASACRTTRDAALPRGRLAEHLPCSPPGGDVADPSTYRGCRDRSGRRPSRNGNQKQCASGDTPRLGASPARLRRLRAAWSSAPSARAGVAVDGAGEVDRA